MNKGKIRQLADYAVRECCDHSKNCHWTVSYDEDCIEMTCHLQYCHNCQTDPVSLLSVLGCNIYDEHDHESAHDASYEDQTREMSM